MEGMEKNDTGSKQPHTKTNRNLMIRPCVSCFEKPIPKLPCIEANATKFCCRYMSDEQIFPWARQNHHPMVYQRTEAVNFTKGVYGKVNFQ